MEGSIISYCTVRTLKLVTVLLLGFYWDEMMSIIVALIATHEIFIHFVLWTLEVSVHRKNSFCSSPEKICSSAGVQESIRYFIKKGLFCRADSFR